MRVTNGASAAGRPAEAPLYRLERRGKPLATPGGLPIVHPSQALMVAASEEIRTRGKANAREHGLYSMLCTQVQFIDREPADGGVTRQTLLDVSFRRCAGPEVRDQYEFLGPLLDYLRKHDLPRLSLAQSVDPETLETGLEPEDSAGLDRLVEFFRAQLAGMTPAGRCVVRHAQAMEGVFVLGVMLAQGACTPNEFAKATAALQCVGPAWGESQRNTDAYVRGIASCADLWLRYAQLAGKVEVP
ncbi:MAG: hypothetical protein ACKOSS_03490 [Planctomycetia bacterium]